LCTAGTNVSCTALITNTGTDWLHDVTVAGHPSCETLLLGPGKSTYCQTYHITAQSNFDNFDPYGELFEAAVSVQAYSLSNSSHIVYAAHVELLLQPAITLILQASTGLVSSAGEVKGWQALLGCMIIAGITGLLSFVQQKDQDACEHRIVEKFTIYSLPPLAGTSVHFNLTAVNAGNVAVRQLNLTIPGVEVLCEGHNMSSFVQHLAVNQHVTCGGAVTFDQDALEGGSRNFSAGGSAANLGGPSAASNSVEVVVAVSPGLQLDVDALNCSRAPRMRE
jgi:hypothetical protein